MTASFWPWLFSSADSSSPPTASFLRKSKPADTPNSYAGLRSLRGPRDLGFGSRPFPESPKFVRCFSRQLEDVRLVV
jgi:hypothetical protein